MKFRSITLKGIRNFEDEIIKFEDGLNIVCGPNESGKSTILDSLLFSITGEMEDLASLKRWRSDYSSINLKYELDTGKPYTVSRTIHPEMKSRLENSTIVEDFEAISSILREHFGSVNRTVLENSSIVKHNEMEILKKRDSKEIIKEQILTALTGSERSAEHVIQYLEETIVNAELFLRESDFKIEDCKGRLIPYAGIDDMYTKMTNKINVYREDIKNYQKKYELLNASILYSNLVKEIEETRKRKEKIEDSKDYIASLPFEIFEQIEKIQNGLRRIEEGMESLILLIKEKEDELIEIKSERKGKGIFGFIGSLFGKKENHKEKESALEGLLEGYRRDYYKLEEEAKKLREEKRILDDQTGAYKGKDLEYLNQIKEQYQREISELLKGFTLEELKQSLEKMGEDKDRLRSQIFRECPDLFKRGDQEILTEKEDLEKMTEILKKETEDVEREMYTVGIKKLEKDRIQRELNALTAQYSETETRKEIDQTVLDTLRSVYIDLRDLFVPQLEEKTSNIMQKITRGKYKTISIRREDLEVSVELPGQSANIKSLSQGTKDQLYFSLRIALSDLLSGGRNLPLLFDESFYTSDEKRLEETFTILKEIAENTQVILFTHNEMFFQYGHPVILKPPEETFQVY